MYYIWLPALTLPNYCILCAVCMYVCWLNTSDGCLMWGPSPAQGNRIDQFQSELLQIQRSEDKEEKCYASNQYQLLKFVNVLLEESDQELIQALRSVFSLYLLSKLKLMINHHRHFYRNYWHRTVENHIFI